MFVIVEFRLFSYSWNSFQSTATTYVPCMFDCNIFRSYIVLSVTKCFFFCFLSFLYYCRRCLIVDFCPFRPFWLMIILAVLIQHITGRFCFIKKTAGTRDLDNRWFILFVSYLWFVSVLLSDNCTKPLYVWCIPSYITEVICSCWHTCCFPSMFWSGCYWQCGAWSSQPCST